MKLLQFLKFVPACRPVCIIDETDFSDTCFVGNVNELYKLNLPIMSHEVVSTYAEEDMLVISILI